MHENLNRRNLLKAVGVSAAGAFAVPTVPVWAQEPARGRKWRMRLSTSSIHFMGLPIEQACERIARLGFEAIDIWSAHQGCPHLDDVAKRLGPEGLKEVLAKNKLKLFAFSVYKGGYAKYAKLLGEAGGGVAVRGSGKNMRTMIGTRPRCCRGPDPRGGAGSLRFGVRTPVRHPSHINPRRLSQ